MRTKHEKRLDFTTRNIVIIAHDQYMVAEQEQINWSLDQNLIVLVLRYYAPNFCIVVYDMNPREITATHAVRLAKHCMEFSLSQAKWN